MPQFDLFERFGQRIQIQPGAFVDQRLAATVGFQRLPVQIIDAGALHFAGARGFAGVAVMGFPALLPVGQAGFGLAQCVLAEFVIFAQLLQLRFGIGHRLAQHRQLGGVAADVLGELLQLALRFVARLVQAMREFALVLDLLLDTRQCATDLVDIGLRLGHRFGGLFAAHTAGFDARFGIALLGDQLLQAGFFLIQLFTQALQPAIQAAVFQRLPLRILDAAFFL